MDVQFYVMNSGFWVLNSFPNLPNLSQVTKMICTAFQSNDCMFNLEKRVFKVRE